MPLELILGLLGLGGVVLTTTGVIIGTIVSARAQKRAAKVQAAANTNVAENKLIDQLQEELARYRDDNDRRVARLEVEVQQLTEENRGYRAFIGVQRDHMAAHGIPLPPWPEGLPR